MQTLEEELILIVGSKNILLNNKLNNHLITPYLEESRQRKIGSAFCIIFPSTTDEIASIVKCCHKYKLPIIPQGGNTGRCFGAQSDNPKAVIINLKKMNRVRNIDHKNMTMTVDAGCILQNLQLLAKDNGLFFPLSLGSEGSCQIGGNLATNAGGINVLRYGNTKDLTLGIEAVTSSGEIVSELVGLRKNNTGYDLKNLLIGSEGTLAIISAVTLKLFPIESNSEHAFLAIDNIDSAIRCLRELQSEFNGNISTFEIMPNISMKYIEKHKNINCPINNNHPWYIWYKVTDNSTIDKDNTNSLYNHNLSFLKKQIDKGLIIDATVAQNYSMRILFKQIREAIVEVQKYEGATIKFDVSVIISKLPELIEYVCSKVDKICPNIRAYPFGHIGDGNIHFNFIRPKNMTDDDFLKKHRKYINNEVLDIVNNLGGSFSAEHGIGSLKIDDMRKYKNPASIRLMQQIKIAFDPYNIMNPGKVVPFNID